MGTTSFQPRVLDAEPVEDLDAWRDLDGGRALEAARQVEPEAVIALIADAGLRGRGGAGFPTATKWSTVAAMQSPTAPTTVVVNGAEGEPGSFKDRAILRRNPYRVLEGTLVAAHAVGADRVQIALKAAFTTEVERVRSAAAEVAAAGWSDGIDIEVVEGPSSYLFGEESALLEVLAGRQPFPRIAPPWRHGVDERTGRPGEPGATDMATDTGDTGVPPTLVNNVETMANVPGIVVQGPDEFRRHGTADSPGTIVCTVSGDTLRHGVAEFPMGTPLRQVIETVGGGPNDGRRFVAALSGVANPLIPAEQFDAPLTYEALLDIGTGLGAAGFIVLDDATDLVAVTQGVARFLAVESCGQCHPCKYDGISIAERLDELRRSEPRADTVDALRLLLDTVDEGARCALAGQQRTVVGSLLSLFDDHVWTHAEGNAESAAPYLVAPILDFDGERMVLDESQATKQPDWTHGDEWSGATPADDIDQAVDITP